MLKERRSQIKKFVATLFESYHSHKGHHKADLPFKFWDVVVLTASDDKQKLAYQMQIDQKISNNELIQGVDYYVFADPVGPKIGCGGATMNVIFELKKIYETNFNKLLILVINAGGLSQRLPSSSALGKIFMALPCEFPMWTLFDLKLASYIPFLKRMQYGIFHAASDTIELFYVDETSNEWNFLNKGMTAIAHPSSVEVGLTHGVFVIDDNTNDSTPNGESTKFIRCSEVLQKPSLETLREKKGIIQRNVENSTMGDFVYTDSCFFIDFEFIDKLLNFYVKEMPLKCEIDGYGDFMQCLGPNSNQDFTKDFRNVLSASPELQPTRQKLYDCLHSCQLNVIAFDCSEFFHLGTTREYLEHFCHNSALAQLVGWNQKTFSVIAEDSEISDDSVVLHSLFEHKAITKASTIIEYSHFACPVEIDEHCIVSNCSATGLPRGRRINIPHNLYLHTVPIVDGETTGYVTIIFGIDDDIKKKFKDPSDIVYLGRLWDCFDRRISFDDEITLWKARLFPCLPDPTSSLLASLDLVSSLLDHQPMQTTEERYSACKVMNCKDVASMLKYRTSLKNEISKNYGPTNHQENP